MEKLIRELIDAAYDTGHYAGDGRSGTDLHRKRIEDRDVLRDKLETRLTAAERLLLDLTPGGSEFHGSPERCAQWAQDRISFTGELAAERNRLRTAADALAAEVSPAIEIVKAACIYINMIGTGGERDERVIKALQTISGDLHTALRKYREGGQ